MDFSTIMDSTIMDFDCSSIGKCPSANACPDTERISKKLLEVVAAAEGNFFLP